MVHEQPVKLIAKSLTCSEIWTFRQQEWVLKNFCLLKWRFMIHWLEPFPFRYSWFPVDPQQIPLMLNVPGNQCMSSQTTESCLATFILDSSCFVSVHVCGFILLAFFFFPSEKYRFLISLILFFHFRSCYMKFQIRLQENQFSFLCLNRPLKCLDLVLKNFCFTEFVCFGCAGGAEHSVLDASTLNFISRRFLTKGKQWIILIVWESNFQKHALAVEYQCCFNCRFHLPSSKSTMNVTVHMFCTPSLFYLLAFRVYWFYYSSLQEERN